jgi:hypothetical protein
MTMNLFLWDEFNGNGVHPNHDGKLGLGPLIYFWFIFDYF